MYTAWGGPLFFSSSKFEQYVNSYNETYGNLECTVGLNDNK